jgi:hypothetical protein
MVSTIYLIYALILLALTIWSLVLLKHSYTLGLLLMILPTAALIYDNAVVGLGGAIGRGELLQALSTGRYLGHVFLPALWILSALALARRSGLAWTGRRELRFAAILLTALLTVVMIFTDLVGISLVPEVEGNALRYVNENRFGGPPIAATTMTLIVMVLGVAVLAKTRWPWMLAGSAFMLLAGTALYAAFGSVATNLGEILFALSLVVTEAHLQTSKVSG